MTLDMVKKTVLAAALALLAPLSGCGWGNGSSGAAALPASTHILAFSAISTARLDVPISGLTLEFDLPNGVTVATQAPSLREIDSASLTPGGAIVGTSLAFGSYSSFPGGARVRLGMVTSQADFRKGEYLRLKFSVQPALAIFWGDLESVPILQQVYGVDAENNTVYLTGKVKTLLTVTQ